MPEQAPKQNQAESTPQVTDKKNMTPAQRIRLAKALGNFPDPKDIVAVEKERESGTSSSREAIAVVSWLTGKKADPSIIFDPSKIDAMALERAGLSVELLQDKQKSKIIISPQLQPFYDQALGLLIKKELKDLLSYLSSYEIDIDDYKKLLNKLDPSIGSGDIEAMYQLIDDFDARRRQGITTRRQELLYNEFMEILDESLVYKKKFEQAEKKITKNTKGFFRDYYNFLKQKYRLSNGKGFAEFIRSELISGDSAIILRQLAESELSVPEKTAIIETARDLFKKDQSKKKKQEKDELATLRRQMRKGISDQEISLHNTWLYLQEERGMTPDEAAEALFDYHQISKKQLNQYLKDWKKGKGAVVAERLKPPVTNSVRQDLPVELEKPTLFKKIASWFK